MSGILADKVLRVFLHNPVYEHDQFRMWGRILKKYYPRGKEALFKSVSALYMLEQGPTKSISD